MQENQDYVKISSDQIWYIVVDNKIYTGLHF